MLLTFLTRFFIIIGAFLLIVWLVLRFSGNWKKTLRKACRRYMEIRQKTPSLSDKEAFTALLDQRYPDTALTKELYLEKERVKDLVAEEIRSNSNFFRTYDLSTLIYCCLVIERSHVLRNKNQAGIKELLTKISREIAKLGLAQY
ncbi:MAG: hypothetical protein ACOWWO_18065 [Peptococcaceae bacterium]